MKSKFKRLLSGILSVAVAINAVPIVSANAEESTEPYPYTMFASSEANGAITINADNVCINGNIATRGTISTNAVNFNVNGTKTEHTEDEMIYFFKKLDYAYFNTDNTDTYLEDYYLEDQNININTPLEAEGNVELVGNINISSGIKALDDVVLDGNVENSNNSVICSQTGDILINTDNVNLNGIIYAPEGSINITAQNLNINSVVMIADTICITCPNLNTNYSSSMAEFIGNESDVDLDVVAYGEYLSDLSTVDVHWHSTVPKGSFDIQVSDNNEDYTTIGTVSDTDGYQYVVSDEFTQKYIRIVETTYYGESLASIPFIVIQSEDKYQTVLLDSDKDGLPDVLEKSIGTDLNVVDTDEDGLSDYYEYLVTKTDSLIYDSVTEGLSDADADSDEDGVSNIDEINNKIDPLNPDTDGDGLSDYYEINIYLTDPANIDSDNDSVEDGAEINIGLDPNNPETFGVPDSEYKVPQSIAIDNPMLSDINTEESPYEISIDLKTNFDIGKELSIVQSGYSYSIQNDAIIGASLDISISDKCTPEDIVIKYNIKEGYRANTLNLYSEYEELNGLKRLNIFKYDKEAGMLLPIDTQFDEENNTLYAEVDELGTYCIMDMEIWFNNLGVTVPIPETEDNNSTPTPSPKSAPKKASPKSSSSWTPTYVNTPIDLVFILQVAGTSKDYFEKEKVLIQEFSQYVLNNNSDVNIYVITYTKSNGNILKNFLGNYPFKSLAELTTALNKISYTSGVTDYCDRGQAFSLLLNTVNLRENADSYVYQLMNGANISHTGSDNSQIINKVKSKLITAYSEIGSPGWRYDYTSDQIRISNDIKNNGDLFLSFSDDILDKVIEHFDGKKSAQRPVYEILLPTSWKKVQLEGEISPDNDIDTDKDSLTDWDEVDIDKLIWHDDGSFDIPTFNIATVVSQLQRFNSVFIDELLSSSTERYYLPIISDPSLADSDSDTLFDEEENYFGTDALNYDTDGDNLPDGTEVRLWFDPTDANPDGDSYNDKEENDNGTSPYVYDMTIAEKGDAFLRGGLLGDFETADDIETLCGQIAFSFIPFVADGRDYFANIFVNLDTKAALLNLGGFLLDIIPGVGSAGDAAKAFPKLSRFIVKYADDAPKALDAIIQASKHFPNSDEVIPGLVKVLPVGAVDEIVGAVKNGDKITKADYKKLAAVLEASGKNADEALGFVAKNADEINFKPQNLIDELISSGKKVSLDKVEFVVKTPEGELLWLEYGDKAKGLHHILYGSAKKPGHINDFANRGITDVKSFMYQVVQSTPVTKGERVGKGGRIEKWAQYIVDDEKYLLAYGDNGFIVSFYPI